MDNIIENGFLLLGLSEKETKVYLTLASVGRIQAAILARKIGVPRTSVYHSLESLTKRGFVSQQIQGGSTYFSANGPEVLIAEIEREKRAIKEKEKHVLQLTEILKPIFRSANHSVPHLQYFDGSENVENMLKQFLPEWMNSMQETGDTLWGYQDHTFVKHYNNWLRNYWASKSSVHQIKLFSNDSVEERALKDKVAGRQVRPLPGGLDIQITLWVSGDYVTVIMTRQQPHYAFQIRDVIFAESLRRVFQSLWSRSSS